MVSKLSKWATMEKVLWRQKLSKLWLKGDKNAKFFYKLVNVCRRRNHLGKIKVNGEMFFFYK